MTQDIDALSRFQASLRPHEVSVALALAELLRRADESGAVERVEWLSNVRAAFARALPQSGGISPLGAGTETGGETDELPRYLEENVLARLAEQGIARGEPEGEEWERVRVNPALWTSIQTERQAIVQSLDDTVRILLKTEDRHALESEEVVPKPIAGGSRLSARGLVKVFRKRKVVNDVALEVSQGEIVGLLGPNGAGKTTTFYMIVGLISPNAGQVYLDSEELTGVPMYKRARRGIGYLAQEPSIFRKLSVEQNIMAILETLKLSRAARKQRLEQLLDELGLRHLRKSLAYSLSGGERRRLEITRALVAEPKFMLLDEPFAGVDPIAVHDIQQIVAGLRHRGIGVIITDHNVEQTLDIVDRAYIMYDGRVRVSGTVGELVWNDEVAEIYFGPTLTARMRERYRRPEMAV
jgi:lipopolysaccharide export system ATP-binding protein